MMKLINHNAIWPHLVITGHGISLKTTQNCSKTNKINVEIPNTIPGMPVENT